MGIFIRLHENTLLTAPVVAFLLSYRVFVNELLEKLLLIYHCDRDH